MPSQPVAAEWAVCAINKFVKSVSAQITSKMASRAHKMENLQCTSYRFSFVDVPLPADASFTTVQSTMGDRVHHGWQRSPKKQALHLTCWALCVDRTMHTFFCRHMLPRKFGVQFLDKIYHPGACFQFFTSAWQFKMTENGSCLARMWCIRVWIELNAKSTTQLVSWFKTQMLIGCGTTNTTDTKMSHMQKVAHATGCWRIWCPHSYMRFKI